MKRANGTGTIVKLSGNRRRPYLIKIPARDSRERIIQKPLSYHATLREAQAALDKYNNDKVNRLTPASEMLNYTVQDVYDGWSSREYKKMEEKERTSSLGQYRAAWNKRISRYASYKMRETTLDMWQSILDEDEDKGCSQSLINIDAFLIRRLYSYAMERDIITKNYAQYLDIPSVDPKVLKGTLNDLQLTQLENMAADGVPWADTVLMLCYTGYRITEFLTLSKFNYHPEQDGYFSAGIKTQAGRDRIVPIHPKVKDYFLRRMAQGGKFIVVDEDGKALTPQAYRVHAFNPIVKALGVPEATPHWCRHTFNTRLHAKEVDEITRKLLMGHSLRNDVNAMYTHPEVKTLAAAIRKLA